jgi:aryl-alcohol dehydrogenase-like predicted oxidoreductase
MKKLRLGSAGPDITRIGLGTWAIGGAGWQFGWGPQDDEDSIAAIRRAVDLGINWVDTAALYGLGHSEEMVGRALEGRRDGVLVATKCGRVLKEDGTIATCLRADSIRRELEASLRRLRTDCIDLYQVHWPVPDGRELEEGWAEVAKAVREGKVRWAGVSNFSVEQLKRVQAIHPVTSLQPPYSMLRRGIEQELLPYCAVNGIGVICYSPMQAGLLTGAFTSGRAAALAGDDWRRNSPYFKEPELSANLAVVDGLRVIAARRGCSVGELAIAWVLRRPGVTGAIVGARRPDQIEGTVGAADLYLTEAELAEIEELLAVREQTPGASEK